MKFLKQLLHTKAPSSSTLLDIAIILSIIPHLFVMKFFMILYIFIALVLLARKNKSPKYKYILMFTGAFLIAISFFNDYNFSNFSRMQFFVSLVSSLLIYAVTLQKTTGEINIYLKLSPAFLMLLSFFFFNSITMLFYTIFTLFVFTLLNIWSRMNTKLIDVIKLTSQLFVLALPVVLILFLVFPRISFKKAEFGFQGDTYTVSGYNGEMSVSSDEVRLSNKLVMEVYFKEQNISDNSLYFRGATLYKNNGLDWIKSPQNKEADKLANIKNIITYDITLYPHAKKWIYALDIPSKKIKKTLQNADFTLSSEKPIYEKTRYSLESALSYKLLSRNLSNTLSVDLNKSKRTYEALKHLKDSNLSDIKKARQLMAFFKEQKILYSLKPKDMDLNNFVDSFLFDSKNGYCIHFSSAFAISARLIGIPSRVVTGFKPSKNNMIENYLLVKSSDAHAWVELYIDDKGWVRFDPTTTAKYSISQNQNQNQNQNRTKNTLFQTINLNFMYVKYIINTWILNYDRVKQLSILNKLLNDTLYLVKFVAWISSFFILLFLLYITIKTPSCKDEIMCEMNKVFKVLKKYNLIKKESETMQEFLLRANQSIGINTFDLSDAYHTLKYANNIQKSDIQVLRYEIKIFLVSVKNKKHYR